MKKILNALFLTIITLVTFSCSDVPAPYDINGGGNGEGPALTGDGTKENPYDIASAMAKQDNSEAWVMGYIVGCINDKSISTDAVFAPPFTNQANILIAADANETDYKKCIPVQLVANTDVRTALNLVNNEGNLGKAVVIKGQLTKYFGVAGLKNPTAAVLDGKDIGDGGDTPSGDLASLLDPSNPVAEVTNTFDDAETDKEYVKEGYVNFAEAGARTWRGKPFNNNGLIQATAYGSKEASVISWFVTPAVNVAQMAVKKVTFDCISAYYKEGTKLEIYFLEKDGTNLKSTLINVGTLPQSADGYSEAVTLSGDLTNVGDKVGFIGFKYIGSETASGTYQIDNLYVGVEPGEGPGPGPDPTGSGTKEDPYDVASVLTLSTATGTQTAWVKGYIVGGVKNGNDANTVDAPEDVVFGLDDIRSSAIIVAGSKDETDYTKCLVIGFGSDSQAAKTALNLVDNPDNLGKEVLLLGTLKYAFGAPGMKTITDHELVTGGEEPNPEEAEQIFFETFDGEGGVTKVKLDAFKGYVEKNLAFADSGIADVRTLNNNFSLWLPANKPNVVAITGFTTTGYKSLKLSYKIACNSKDGVWKTIKVKCGDTDMTVPDGQTATTNTFQEIVLDNIPLNIASISFVSDSENTQGFRIDDIKLEGTK